MQRREVLGRLAGPGIALAVGGGLLAWKSFRRDPAADVAQGAPAATVVDDANPVPEFRLSGPRGLIDRSALEGRWTLMFFGYTQCPDICPTTLSGLVEALRGVEAARRPQVVFVSVDPARDTHELLGQYVPAFDPTFIGVAGSDAELAALVKHLGVHYERQPPAAHGGYMVDHTAAMFLIDPKARLKAVFSHPPEPAAVREAYLRLTR